MGESIAMLVFAALLVFIGVENVKGNISSIHWYNRRRITEETRPKYGKLMGSATLIFAGGLTLFAILNMISQEKVVTLIGVSIVLISAIVCVGLMLYAQIKYNKGIF